MNTAIVTVTNSRGEHEGVCAYGKTPPTVGDWVEVEIPTGNDPLESKIESGFLITVVEPIPS